MEPPEPQDHESSEGGGTLSNVVLLIVFAAVVGLGVWLLDAMLAQRNIDDCAAQGRRNCASLDLPAR